MSDFLSAKHDTHDQQKLIDLPPKVFRTNFIPKSVEGSVIKRAPLYFSVIFLCLRLEIVVGQ